MLVYVGAVMTLFLFVVMMLNIDIESTKNHFLKYMPFGLILVALLTGLLLKALPLGIYKTSEALPAVVSQTASIDHLPEITIVEKKVSMSNTEALGMVLYTDYVFALFHLTFPVQHRVMTESSWSK